MTLKTILKTYFETGDIPTASQFAELIDSSQQDLKIVSVTDYGAIGNGITDDTVAIQAAITASPNGVIFFPKSTEYKIGSSIVFSNSCTLVFSGRQSPIRQTSWGVPIFEIRAANVNMLGHPYLKTTQTRTAFDAAALTASANTATVKTECSGDPKAAGAAVYCSSAADHLYIDHLDVYGFIAGLLAGDNDNVSIDNVTVEAVDFGLFGNPANNWHIGHVNAITILDSQGVEPHAVYFPGTASYVSDGLTIGSVNCASIEGGSRIVSLKYARAFSIGSIVGHTDVSGALSCMNSTGVVGQIVCRASKAPTTYGTDACIIIQSSSTVSIGIVDIDSYHDDTTASNAAVNCTTSAVLDIDMLRITMKAATGTAAIAARSSSTMRIHNPYVVYDNVPDQYAFVANQTGAYIGVYLPELVGSSRLLNVAASTTYDLYFNPDLVPSLAELSIVADDGVYTTAFVGGSAFFTSALDNDPTPQVRQTSRLLIAYTGSGVVITDFPSGSPGQTVIVLFQHTSVGGITVDFSGTTLKGNGGVDWIPVNGDFMVATYDGSNWYCSVHDCTT